MSSQAPVTLVERDSEVAHYRLDRLLDPVDAGA
jgi:hypothetical protein